MDKLKTYINSHRAEFDTDEPTQGHFERLEAKLTAVQKPSTGRRALKYWPFYAAASVVVLISLGINEFLFKNQKDNPIEVICNDPSTMKLCYINKMQNTAMLIDQLTENDAPLMRQVLQMEVAGIIKDNQLFDTELPDELSSERAQAILAGYYEHHLETLQDIVQILLTTKS